MTRALWSMYVVCVFADVGGVGGGGGGGRGGAGGPGSGWNMEYTNNSTHRKKLTTSERLASVHHNNLCHVYSNYLALREPQLHQYEE